MVNRRGRGYVLGAMPTTQAVSTRGWRVSLDFHGQRLAERGFAGDVAVTVGEGFSCAIVAGDVYCWGRNENGQLGRGAPGNRDVVPARVAFPSE